VCCCVLRSAGPLAAAGGWREMNIFSLGISDKVGANCMSSTARCESRACGDGVKWVLSSDVRRGGQFSL